MLKILCLCLLFVTTLKAQPFDPERLTLEDKVSMLFMIADYGDEALVKLEGAGTNLAEVTEQVDHLVATRKIGGVLFKGRWTPTGLKERIRHLSALSTTPLLFAQDLEWGLSMRHDGVVELPKALCIGAITDDRLVRTWADALALTAKEVGINLFLGPVADVNTNANNPVIHDRSFGDDPHEVARKIAIVIRTLHEHGMATCVKHFPGHGNTTKDSHTDLPVIQSSIFALERVELLPFKEAIANGVDCVMTAHICLPATESGDAPASLSPFWCQKILRDQLKFPAHGVVISDDLIMAGALGNKTCVETAALAVMAGNDLCIVSKNFTQCFDAVVRAVQDQKVREEDIDTHVRRVVHLQCQYQHHKKPPHSCHASLVYPNKLKNRKFANAESSRFDSEKTSPLWDIGAVFSGSKMGISAKAKTDSSTCLGIDCSDMLYKQALTAFGEPFIFSPDSTLVLQVGSMPLCPLLRKLVHLYPKISVESMRRTPRREEIDGILHALSSKRELLVVLCDLERSPALSFGITPSLVQGLERLQKTGCSIRYVLFGSPYAIPLLPHPVRSALIAYERTSGAEEAVLQTLIGAFTPVGRLPVNIQRNHIND